MNLYTLGHNFDSSSQLFCVLLYAFYWVIPQRLNFRRRGITKKKAYKVQNTEEV